VDYKEGISVAQIEKMIRRLKVSKEISNLEAVTIYSQISKFLQDEDAVVKLLALLPHSRDGLVTIAQGLFSSSSDVQMKATEIILKVERTVAGKHFVQNLNYFFMLKY